VRAREYARAGYSHFENQPQSKWHWTFTLLYAEMHLWNGDTEQAQRLLSEPPPATYPDLLPRYQMLQGYVLFRRQKIDDADKLLREAYRTSQALGQYETAADIQLLRAPFLIDSKRSEAASRNALEIARGHGLRYQEAAAHLNLGMVQIGRSRFGDAIPEFDQAERIAISIGATTIKSFAIGNIATCYYNLGDFSQAIKTHLELLPLWKEAGLAVPLRNSYLELGTIYLLLKENEKAIQYFRKAMALVRESDSPGAFASVAAATAQALAAAGSLEEAERYNREGLRACNKDDKDQLASLILNEALIASRRAEHQLAIEQYTEAIRVGQDEPSVVWQAYAGLATEQAALGNRSASNTSFERALHVIEQNRSEQLIRDYKITFLSQLIRFYQQYVDLLISEGETGRALEIADSSRASVLTEDLLGESGTRRSGLAEEIRRAAQQSNTTFLFYWLAPERSYLWVIKGNGSQLLPLPAQEQIDRDVLSYRHFLEQEKRDPLITPNPAGGRLFDTLVAPAGIPKGSNVVILPDGSLHNLNFETLPVYRPTAESRASASGTASYPHYWLDDDVISIAPSLSVLSVVPSSRPQPRSLLLIGNTITQGTGFAPLPDAASEIEGIKRRFASGRVVTYTGAAATAGAYRGAHPEQFSNIHFAAHAEANQQRPLDSAIILSPEQSAWKLYARDVADIPLRADLVTISACRGAGATTLSGEGLVGFAWAFFQAGARNVVTSLWDVSDRSTADLMNTFYGNLAAGESYQEALREAKLKMIRGVYRKPYYWGPFQLYSRCLNGSGARAPRTHPVPIESAAAGVHQ
jgi:CHAT domain-containing protein